MTNEQFQEFMRIYEEANILLEQYIAINKDITKKLQEHSRDIASNKDNISVQGLSFTEIKEVDDGL